MPPPKTKQGDGEQDQDVLSRQLRPHAPVSVVKAAKASLKEPSRPYTPLEGSRQLFATTSDSPSNRPTSSYGTPSSKLFFDSTPKLPVAKLPDYSPSRPDKVRSILDSAHSGSSFDMGGREASPARLMVSGSGRPTAAETVAALKASMASSGSPLAPDRMSGWASGDAAARRRQSGAGSQGAQGAGAGSSPQYDDEDGVGDVLDPHRNDDLPARPTTSRGRPSSASAAASAPMDEPTGPVPPPLRMGNNAQVLGITAEASDSDSADDEAYRHLYTYAVPRPAEDLLETNTQDTASPSPSPAAAASRSRPAGLPPASPSTPSTPPVVSPPLDPNDPVAAWRMATEQALAALGGAIASLAAAAPGAAQRDATADVLRAATVLAGHVRYMRQQPHSSRWLATSSCTFRDATGAALSMRETIAEHTYRLMDSSSSELLLKACGIVLRVVKSRQPLLQAAKLLYRLSKDTANDRLFRAEALLEPILRTIGVMVASGAPTLAGAGGTGAAGSGASGAASTTGHGSRPGSGSSPGAATGGTGGAGGVSVLAASMHEPLVYLNGCLKNVSNDASNQRALVKLGALQLMATVLTHMASRVDTSCTSSVAAGADCAAEGSSSGGSAADMAAQVVVQVTGVLRNLAVSLSHASAFITAAVLPALREAAAALSRHQEVILNVGRILSKLSLHDGCQAALEADVAYAPLLMRLLSVHASQRPVLLRIAFVLGNLTTASDGYRAQVAAVPGALGAVVSILSDYARPAEEESQGAGEASGAAPGQLRHAAARSGSGRRSAGANHEECAVKMLRLVANLSINVTVGPALAARQEVAEALQELLQRYTMADAEELVLNCVCALTNLSFYHAVADSAVLRLEPAATLRYVTPLLLCDNEEAQIEAARAYSNFSRLPGARLYIREARVLEALLLLLDHSNLELLYSVCGTLVNMTADWAGRAAIVELGGAWRLVEVMERAAMSATSELQGSEVDILGVVFKVVYNLCVEDATPGDPLPALPVFSDDEVSGCLEIIQHIRCTEALDLDEEVLQLADSCVGQLQIISRKFASLNLEPLAAP